MVEYCFTKGYIAGLESIEKIFSDLDKDAEFSVKEIIGIINLMKKSVEELENETTRVQRVNVYG